MISGSFVFTPSKLDEDIPVILISLLDQVERRKDLVDRGLPSDWAGNFFPATDMRSLDPAEASVLNSLHSIQLPNSRAIRPTEIGCALSHRAAAQWLAASEHYLALVLEDDVVPQVSNWASQIRETALQLLPHAESGSAFICHLGPREDQIKSAIKRRVVSKNRRSISGFASLYLHSDPHHGLWRAHAYLISKGAAERSDCRDDRILTLADDWLEQRRRGWIDEIFFTRPRLLAQDEDRPSTIRPKNHDDDSVEIPEYRSFLARVGIAILERNFRKRLCSSSKFRFERVKAHLCSFLPYRIKPSAGK